MLRPCTSRVNSTAPMTMAVSVSLYSNWAGRERTIARAMAPRRPPQYITFWNADPITSEPGSLPSIGTSAKITTARENSMASTTRAIRPADSHICAMSICMPTNRKIKPFARVARYSQKCSINSAVDGEIFDLPQLPMVKPAATTAMMPLTCSQCSAMMKEK